MNKVKQIIHRKLGKERANGLAFCEAGVIHIDSRLSGYEHLYTLIHEICHVQNPTWSEIKIEGHSKEMAKLLWENNYRQIKE
jgi:Zn-dependent peptidase ImmA (M78 family)